MFFTEIISFLASLSSFRSKAVGFMIKKVMQNKMKNNEQFYDDKHHLMSFLV